MIEIDLDNCIVIVGKNLAGEFVPKKVKSNSSKQNFHKPPQPKPKTDKKELIESLQRKREEKSEPKHLSLETLKDTIEYLVGKKQLSDETAIAIERIIEANDGGRSYRKEVIEAYKNAQEMINAQQGELEEIIKDEKSFDVIKSGANFIDGLLGKTSTEKEN